MKNFLLPIFLLSLSFLYAQIPEKSEIDPIFQEWTTGEVPGGALAIVKGGEIIYKQGYGLADIEHRLPVEPSSVFYIGSVSKQFVTFCILLLEEQGKVSLDDSIQTYLPDFPPYGHTLTLRHFIHHTSGVRDFLTLMDLKGRNYLDHMEVSEVYELIKRQKELNFVPGDQYLYSNSCYFMLALIVKKASGMSIREFAQKEIFEPLGMKHTQFYDDNRNFVYNKAFSYQASAKGFDNLIMRFDLVGSGGIYSTVEDLFLWDQNFYANTLGKGTQAIIDKMHEEGLLNSGKSSGYAFALNNGTYKGLRTVSHSGALAGYRAQLLRFPDQEFSVIILSNRSDGDPTLKAYQVADVFLKDQFKAQEEEQVEKVSVQKALPINDMDRNVFTGYYGLQPGLEISISMERDTLWVVQHWTGDAYTLEPADDFSFKLVEDSTIRLYFHELKDNKTQVLYSSDLLDRSVEKWQRKEPLINSSINLQDFVGTYFSPELEVNYDIFSEEGILKVSQAGRNTRDLSLWEKDVFYHQNLEFRFLRENTQVKGFLLNAGRVRNLGFEKNDATSK